MIPPKKGGKKQKDCKKKLMIFSV